MRLILNYDKTASKLFELRKEKMTGHYIRARTKWIDEGENPTKYFCNMESRNYYSKLISRIQLNNGVTIMEKQIIIETKYFTKNNIRHHLTNLIVIYFRNDIWLQF